MNSLPINLESSADFAVGTSSTRSEAAYSYVRLLLLEGPLSAGEKLSVVALCEALQCSRVPVMEALKRLAGEGFVEIFPQVGCRVVSPRVGDVRDFFTLFGNVEGTVIAFAAERRTADDLEEFDDVYARLEAGARTAGGPAERDPTYRRLNLLFHSCVHRMARSPVSSAIAAGLWDRSDFYVKLTFGSLYFSDAVNRAHGRIRNAIIAGDSEAARVATYAHLTAVGDRVTRRLAADKGRAS